MGLLSGKTYISVASSVYNLAGIEDKRPDFLKTAVVSGIVTPQKTISDTIVGDYLGGPGIKLRAYARWATRTGYTSLIGQTTGKFSFVSDIDTTALATLIPHAVGETVVIQSAQIGSPDYTYWVDQWMVANFPAQVGTAFTTDFDRVTQVVTVTFIDASVHTFTITDYDPNGVFFYISYSLTTGSGVTKSWSALNFIIYQQGTGNASLDAFFVAGSSTGSFYPIIPMRLDNQFISSSHLNDVYPAAKKALKKSIGAKYDSVIAKIADNPSLGDIDYAYVVFGVSFNVKENSCKRYLYEFFQTIMLGEDLTGAEFLSWNALWTSVKPQRDTWFAWKHAQELGSGPLFGTPEPPFPPVPMPPEYSIDLAHSNRLDINYNVAMFWNGIIENTGSGLAKLGAKVGELWIETITTQTFTQAMFLDDGSVVEFSPLYMPQVRITWQTTATTWKSLDLYGLNHRNRIYYGREVKIYADEALLDSAESGFIVPLHEDIFRGIPLKDSTQMSTACAFLVFNSVTVKKTAWYTSDFFQFFEVIIVIIIAVVIAYFTGGAGIGILGSALDVGTVAGFAGTAAILVGAAINAIAGIIVVQIISRVSVALLGDKIGAIVGAIASLIAVAAITDFSSGTNMLSSYNEMLSSDNLMKLTGAVMKGYSALEGSNTQDLAQKTQDLIQSSNAQSLEFKSKYEEFFGSSRVIDPLQLTDTAGNTLVERPDTFLARTLMTGSDIVGLSQDMIANYTKITLNTDLPI